jgi:hypothetical protein
MTASNLKSEPYSAIYPYVLLSTYRLLVCQVCRFASVADEVATSLLSVPFSVKEEIHHLSLAHTLAKSSFTEKGTVF